MLQGMRNQIAALVVFINGFVVMGVELTASRVVAPYLGTTTVVWSSLIGVILAGLGVGYYVGGLVADRVRRKKILALAAGGASAYLLLIPRAKDSVLGLLSAHLPYGAGAIGASMVLLFVPATLMGAVTTYTIRLRAEKVETTGSVHGRLYGISTLGSLLGVAVTSFYLVPVYTTGTIFILFAVLMGLVALLALGVRATD